MRGKIAFRGYQQLIHRAKNFFDIFGKLVVLPIDSSIELA